MLDRSLNRPLQESVWAADRGGGLRSGEPLATNPARPRLRAVEVIAAMPIGKARTALERRFKLA
jgi:hypothetical protein